MCCITYIVLQGGEDSPILPHVMLKKRCNQQASKNLQTQKKSNPQEKNTKNKGIIKPIFLHVLSHEC